MRVVVIGGTGHTGTYLVPRLIESGYEVVVISRQKHARYQADATADQAAWEHVQWVEMDRAKAEKIGEFGMRVATLKPHVVIDMICYQPESARHLVEALRARIQLMIHCGTIWASGPSLKVPSTESEPLRPICDYGRRKAAIEEYLLDEARRTGFPVTVLRPGHMVGPGWTPVNPAANFNPKVYGDLAQGKGLCLPNLGMETLHHVHADDVAAAVESLVEYRTSQSNSAVVLAARAAVRVDRIGVTWERADHRTGRRGQYPDGGRNVRAPVQLVGPRVVGQAVGDALAVGSG